jgi:hypothetical protein
VAQPDQVTIVGRADDQRGEDAPLVAEDEALVAVAVRLPGDGVDHRAGFGPGRQLVDPVDVGDPADAARRGRRAAVAVHPPRTAGGVDDQVGLKEVAVDDDPGGVAACRVDGLEDVVD